MSLGLVADRWGMEGGVVGWVEQSNKHHWIRECFHGYPMVVHHLGACYINRDRHASQKKIPCLYGRFGMICDGRDERYPQITEMLTKECWSSVTCNWGTLHIYAGSNCWPTTVLSLTSHQFLHLATTACSFCFTIFQNPDNVIFVMDATIGQACESQVNFMFLTALI